MKKNKQISTIHALIAHTAISGDFYLFTADDDSTQIAKYNKLQLFKE